MGKGGGNEECKKSGRVRWEVRGRERE